MNGNYTPQPASWWLKLLIGSTSITTIPPQYISSFTQTRTIMDMGNTFEFTVSYEGSLTDIEYLIAQEGFGGNSKNLSNVYFQYGIQGGASTGVFEGVITGYEVEFSGGITTLTVSGTTSAYVPNLKSYTKAYYGKTIDQIVVEIAKDNGLKVGLIEPCLPIYSHVDELTGNLTHKYFVQHNISPIKFIAEELCPYAVSALTGASGYVVYLTDKNRTLNFCTPQYKSQPSSLARYYFYAGNQSNIISWNPQIFSALQLAPQGGSVVMNAGMDTLSNEFHVYFSSNTTSPSRPVVGDKRYIADNVALTILNTSSAMEAELKAKAQSLNHLNMSLDMMATMEIPGDPNLEPNTTVDILINNPDGTPHYTTGTYLVAEIVDRLDSGGWTSQVTLIKNAVSKGAGNAGGHKVVKPKPKS